MPEGTLRARTFWWDRARPVDADVSPLRAVIFDADALADERDGDLAPRAGLIDLVMSLFVTGIWVAVVGVGRRERVEPFVRQLVGDGLVETIVTPDDLVDDSGHAGRDAELYRLALWELGITAGNALAVGGSVRGFQATVAAGLPAVVVTAGYSTGQDFPGAAAVRTGYAGADQLLAAGCQQLHRRWWIAKRRAALPARG